MRKMPYLLNLFKYDIGVFFCRILMWGLLVIVCFDLLPREVLRVFFEIVAGFGFIVWMIVVVLKNE